MFIFDEKKIKLKYVTLQSMTVKYVDPKCLVLDWALLRSLKTLLVNPYTKG